MMKGIKVKKAQLYELVRQIRMVAFDFDGVFTDNRVLVFQDGTEAVICSRSEGLGLAVLKELGIALLVISTEENPVVSARCRKLNLPCIQGCENKLNALQQEIKKLNISLKEVAYLGNDRNDINCLREVGLAVGVADSHPELFEIVHCVTESPGGRGAVREFCDFVEGVKSGKLS
jgi:YrbI family 3-deoxy-D-manno-octulosonate 8-phosphate phosphatase